MASSWSITNANSYLEPEIWESFVNHRAVAGMLLGVLVVCGSYPIVHRIYMAKSFKYQELTTDQQIVVVQHTVEAFFLSIIFAPFSWLICSIFFEMQSIDSLGNKVTATIPLMGTVIIMYMVEIAGRFRNIRPLVLAHHLCAYLSGVYLVLFSTTAMSLLAYFITYEAPTFIGLIMYRLAPTHRLTRPIMIIGMIVFGLSRPVQFVWIIGSLIATWEHLNVGHAIFQIVLTTFFTALQLYSLSIHWDLYKKCSKMTFEEQKDISVRTENAKEDDQASSDSSKHVNSSPRATIDDVEIGDDVSEQSV